MKLEELTIKLKALKEELNKNVNEAYSSEPNMIKDEKGGPANPHMGHSSFNMDHVKAVSAMKDHGAAKKYAHDTIDASSATPKNKAKIKSMINGSKHVAHLATGMSNHILAHPSEGLKVAKSEKLCMSENGQWSMQKWDMEKRCWEGYEPTPGKKAYEKDSCQSVKKEELSVAPETSNNKKTFKESFAKSSDLAEDELEITEWNDGDIDIVAGSLVQEQDFNYLCKTLCEKKDLEELDKKEWAPKAEHKSEKGGLTAKGRDSYNKATGGNLKPPQPGGGSRKRSFCARNKGQIDKHNIDCKKDSEKRACKARRRWKCNN